jgi:hypothetical protein
MNRVEAWNHIIEELDAKTLENADGLSVNELLEMIHKNYRDSFDSFVEEHKDDPVYEDEYKNIKIVDKSLGEVYDSDKRNFQMAARLTDKRSGYLLAAREVIAASIHNLLTGDFANAYILLSNVKDAELDEDTVTFKVMGATYRISVDA